MIARRAAGDQAPGLTDGPRDADLTLGFFIRTTGFELAHQGVRDPGLAETAEGAGLLQGEHGHDTRQDRHGHASRAGTVDEAEVILVIQEELGRDEVRAGRDLAGEEADIGEVVRGVR